MFNKPKTVLISGASIAGPTLAFWLCKYGFDVTVVERSDTIRGGGYPIDVRGTAIDVVERMGILPQLQASHIHSKKITFVNPDGSVAGILLPEELTGGMEGRDIELPRGSLTESLFDLTKLQPVRYMFNDSISSLNDDGDGVDVTFKSGRRDRFDLVIGADGLHSNTRRLTFGEENQFSKYLGYCFNGFTIPNDIGLSHESVTYATPGRFAILSAVGDSDTLHAFLTFSSEEPPFTNYQDADRQRKLTAEMFADSGWIVPRLVEAMKESADLYYDIVSQIHMPHWTKGRIALVGDSAYAASFLSGQGSSVALVGAYILAGELATHEHHEEAFAAYEKIMRPFAEANQALAGSGGTFLLPRTCEELEARNQALAALQLPNQKSMPGDESGKVHSMLRLPDYAALL
ncbi:FAD-dependent monooxygenase [Paenibacillus sp. WQ 127069]|uniref:FAD-dependent monooxygenase n=1 Tax=Paenibacillus baimaensis TaxID=2982185 RepID=A0ABT2UBC3_9BACL|nr:FAD-dependent monooxygenase [Paenibacillus sp. WQ 127069]MCU6791944.1 FAD-dependent monooxygenase [Paenibacillus sp. WQ 127069]